jgi:hypothetical protein
MKTPLLLPLLLADAMKKPPSGFCFITLAGVPLKAGLANWKRTEKVLFIARAKVTKEKH